MNFDFSDDQKALREQAARFLRDQCPPKAVRAILEGGDTYDRKLWKAVAEMGWMGTAIPEEFGGLGLGYLELCVIAEELGRVVAPIPFASSVYLATEALLVAGSAEQKQKYLPKLASGELIGTFASSEGPNAATPRSVKTTFRNGKLDGAKEPVADGSNADFAVVLAKTGDSGDRALSLVIVLGAPTAAAAREAVALVVERLGAGPVATGPEVADVADAGRSLRAALAALHAVAAWPAAPRPVRADDLLPERVLSGDPAARHTLLTEIHQPLLRAGSPLIATVDAYLDAGGSLEGAARRLYVHTNTVRYRLRRVTELIGWDPTDPREGYVIRTALAVGRLTDGTPAAAGP